MPCRRIVFSTFRGCMSIYTGSVMNGPKATSALSPFDSQLRTLIGAACRSHSCHDRTHRTQSPLPSVSLTAPVHRGLLQLELLHQEIGTIVEIIERGAGPIRGLARRRVAIAPCRDPFAGAEHIAGTNGFLRIGGVIPLFPTRSMIETPHVC